MMQNELMKQLKTQQDLILTNKKDLEKQKSLPYMTSKELVKKYIELQEKIETITQPKKKIPNNLQTNKTLYGFNPRRDSWMSKSLIERASKIPYIGLKK
jgi:hypothetical protein